MVDNTTNALKTQRLTNALTGGAISPRCKGLIISGAGIDNIGFCESTLKDNIGFNVMDPSCAERLR